MGVSFDLFLSKYLEVFILDLTLLRGQILIFYNCDKELIKEPILKLLLTHRNKWIEKMELDKQSSVPIPTQNNSLTGIAVEIFLFA